MNLQGIMHLKPSISLLFSVGVMCDLEIRYHGQQFILWLIFYHYLFYLELVPEKNKLIAAFPAWGPAYRISFDVKINNYPKARYANVFQLTTTNNDCCNIGDRIPSVFLQSSGEFLVTNQIGDNPNKPWWSPVIPKNVFFHVEYEQLKVNNKVKRAFKNIQFAQNVFDSKI